MEELSREDVSALAGEVLEALGVEKVEMDGEEQEAVKRAVEAWRKGKGDGTPPTRLSRATSPFRGG